MISPSSDVYFVGLLSLLEHQFHGRTHKAQLVFHGLVIPNQKEFTTRFIAVQLTLKRFGWKA